jgi:tetratricopeptide (TPR) repeat protein
MPPAFLLPFAPTDAAFVEHRAFGAGYAEVLSLALAARGHPIDFVPWMPEVADFLMHARAAASSSGVPAGIGVVGLYPLATRSSLRLVAVTVPEGDVVAERTFDLLAQDMSAALDDIGRFIGACGQLRGRPGGAAPPSFADLHLAARMLALEWSVEFLSSILDPGFQGRLAAIAREVIHELDRPYLDRMAREFVIVLAQLMRKKMHPAGGDALSHVLGGMVDLVGPAGKEHLFAVVDAGLARGGDRVAFVACRVALLHHLGLQEDALAAVDELRLLSPVDGWYWTTRCLVVSGRFDQAIDSADEGLRVAPDAPFRDIVRGSDAAPESSATWRGSLLLMKGAAQLGAKRFLAATVSLREALRLGTDEFSALEHLAHAYRNWGAAELEKGRHLQGVALLRKHGEVLERLFEICPRREEVQAALSVVDFLGQLSLKRRWEARAAALLDASSRAP